MMYVNQKFIDKYNKDCILLEIKLPREIFKSPRATEMALASLLQNGGISSWYAKNFDGALPHYSSLEIASLEGVIHFYIRINKKFKNIVESNFYAQYPGIEIVEADDYTKLIRYHHLSKDVSMWGQSFKLDEKWKPVDLSKGEPYKEKDEDYKMSADFYPIKTYVDYELDKDPKEEFKVDPITPLLEYMGSVTKGEYFWYQVLVQDEGVYNDKKMPKFYVNKISHKHISLSEMADTFKKQLRTSHYIKHGDLAYNDYGEVQKKKVEVGKDADGKPIIKEVEITYDLITKSGEKNPDAKVIGKKETELTPEEKDKIESINKKLSKPLALIVVRIIYVAKNESFDNRQINNVLSFPRPYKGANGLSGVSFSDPYTFPWEKMGGKRVHWRAEEIFEEYVEREGFFPHIGERTALDKFEDRIFYPYTMKSRKMFRMMFEAIFHPFDHPHPTQVSVVNMEELATLWHLPGQVAGMPTLPRIDSNKGSAPSNLPV